MKSFRFKKIDAFATQKSSGNPAGYIWLDSKVDISPAEMQQIAKELKGFVNEVGFVTQTSPNGFDLKYYSAEREVDFCGHATIAIMYDLAKTNHDLQQYDLFHIKTNKGDLTVENRIIKEDSVFIMSPNPVEIKNIPTLNAIADKLKIDASEIDLRYPISIINAGLSTLIVPIRRLDSILNISPLLDELKDFCFGNSIDIIEVFTGDVADKANNYRTRVFAPTFGYIEDPATGSGNSALGYYLIKNDLWNGSTIKIEQNGLRDRFNLVKLQKQKDTHGNERVYFGGGAITRIEGAYLLQ